MGLGMAAEDVIDRIVRTMRTVAVVGLSDKPSRTSYAIASYLQERGIRIIPVNPTLAGSEVLGEKVYAAVSDIPRDIHIDVVDIFRRSEFVASIVDEVIARGESAIWMQVGVVDEKAAARARAAGHAVVMDLCIGVELEERVP